MCNVICTKNTEKLSPMVLDNELYTYCTVTMTEVVKQAVDAHERS